jgi:hypothetical protein
MAIKSAIFMVFGDVCSSTLVVETADIVEIAAA